MNEQTRTFLRGIVAAFPPTPPVIKTNNGGDDDDDDENGATLWMKLSFKKATYSITASRATDIKNLLWQCFVTDEKLISKYHLKAGQGICNCVNDTLEAMSGCDKITVYALKDQFTGNTAGYFGIEEYHGDFWLTGFFLKPEYRTPAGHAEFWAQVWKKAFECGLPQNDGGGLLSSVYAKNEPANKFLSKHGSLKNSIAKEGEEPYNIYIVCQ